MAQKVYVLRKGDDADIANVTASGTLAVTGATTLSSTLAVTGAITATAGVRDSATEVVSADGAIAVPSANTTYYITKAGVAAMTLVDPTSGTDDNLVLTFVSTTANAHTLDLVTGINGGAADVGTFGGAAGDGVSIVAYGGVWYQLPGANTNVTFA